MAAQVRSRSRSTVMMDAPAEVVAVARKGLVIPRRWTRPGINPFDEVTWELRAASITNEKGEVVFEQKDVEVPSFWTQLATNVVVSKYFRGALGTPARERSVKQLIGRVANTITDWGLKDGYFATPDDADAFRAELTYLLLHQYTAFNSPVWFNVGIEPRPQCSACQPYHALINTAHGLMPIGEIVEKHLVGLPVYDNDGLTQVVAVKQNGRKPVYRVRLNDGFSIETTGDHLVCAHAMRRTRRLEWHRVDQLKAGMTMRVYAHTPTTVTAPAEAKAVAEAALAGWLQADGFVGQYDTGTNRSLTVEFMTVDDQEFDWVMQHLETAFPGHHYHVRDVETQDQTLQCRRIRCYGEALRPFVERFSLLKRGQDLRIPQPIWAAPNDAAAAYVKSLFQSDGYAAVHVPSAHVAFAVTSKAWAEELQRLLTRFGIYARLRQKKEQRPDRYDMWELDISIRSEREAFQRSIGFISERKNAKLRQSLETPGKHCPEVRYATIVSIEPIGETEVYDIQTVSGRYLTNSVLVHNCFILSVEDTMDSILEWYRNEGMIFKYGSGSGVNVSPIRSARERLAGGGTASGPVSFMRAADASAGVIKSGGKCFKEGTLVATPDGWKRIESLQIGELVFTHEGPRPVADFMPNGRKQCYKVRTREGYEVEVTEGHKFAFWNAGEGRFEVRPIEHFSPGDPLYILLAPSEGGETIPLIVPEANDPPKATTTAEMTFPTELTEEFAYILGLMYGDGELRTTYPYRVRVAFGKNAADQDAAVRFIAYSQRVFGEAPILLGDETGHQQIGFTRKRLVEFLTANGIAKGKAATLHFPQQFFGARQEVRSAFIAGLIDSDGCYQPRGGWYIASIDRAFLVSLQRLLLTLGIPSKVKLSRARQGTWQPLYRLCVVGHTFVERLVQRIIPHSSKARLDYVPSDGADKGWGYRPSLFTPLAARVERRGGYHVIDRTVGSTNETTGYGALATLSAHPDAAVAHYVRELSHCVQVTLESVEPTEVAETYDIEVEGVHLLSANGFYASNTRRAAKMVVLNADHPDIKPFILCKWKEEEKAHKLIDVGYDASIDGEAYGSVFFQNANNSVRATDEFMKRALADGEWELTAVTTGEVIERVKARDLLRLIAEATWHCGDPGMQFDTTINDWHTCPNTGRINASNPCSEYMHLDNSACNLSSINLLKFLDDQGTFLIEPFKYAVRIMITAQDIVVDNSSYPTAKIDRNARDYRELGLGFANLGALLMSQGIAYDSEEGRAWAGTLTALMCGHAYEVSGQIAQEMGPYAGFAANREPQLRVLRKHRAQADKINHRLVPPALLQAAIHTWDTAIALSERGGVRNSQVTVIAPTGTIAFMMDCDTTGIEPDIALIKYKRLVGGGMLKIVNQTVPKALKKLDYAPEAIEAILKHLDEKETIEGAPGLKPEHLSVFDCAFKPVNGTRTIHAMGHVRMMAAVQPFISGAISKTVNLPNEATVEDIMHAYTEAWRLGLKAIAIYRDGSKRVQPLSTSGKGEDGQKAAAGQPYRRRLADERQAITHKFSVGGHEGYITVGLFEDGTPGEIFITMSKEGSTLSGMMDSFATMVSLALQYGVPLKVLVTKFSHTRFEPSGVTNNKEIRFAKSVVDYIFRWMALKFLPKEEAQEFKVTETSGAKPAAGAAKKTEKAPAVNPMEQHEKQTFVAQADSPACSDCGSLMVRNGNCYKCINCGTTSGCS